MLRPSYTELMNVLNDGSDSEDRVQSRYTIVIAAAKRARQLIDGSTPMEHSDTDKAVSIAVKEMYNGRIKVSLRDDGEYTEGVSSQDQNFI